MNKIKKNFLILFLIINIINFKICNTMTMPVNFVYLRDIDSTIIESVRYATLENFLGRSVKGYKKPVIILTKQTAEALKKVQEDVKKDGYSLVVYDGYRPQQAVDDFLDWSNNTNLSKKAQYYPRIEKARMTELHYVATVRSGHSRGSTVDLTLIKLGNSLQPIKEEKRKLLDGFEFVFLNDGTIDMGSSFDLFDTVSHYINKLIPEKFNTLRKYLRNIMEKHGFEGCKSEWWHFTLKNELYPADKDSSYFNFVIE